MERLMLIVSDQSGPPAGGPQERSRNANVTQEWPGSWPGAGRSLGNGSLARAARLAGAAKRPLKGCCKGQFPSRRSTSMLWGDFPRDCVLSEITPFTVPDRA